MSPLIVPLGDRSYPIHIGAGLLDNNQQLAKHLPSTHAKVVIVTNETVAPLYASKLQQSLDRAELPIIILPDGEEHKNLRQFEVIMDHLLTMHAARDTLLIALGGGVIGDICGFAAACYQRGIAFWQVPTTLLAQVDSSVGGKTAVNHPLGKNMIGAFHQPKAVFIDTNSLKTLPDREFAAGMAEVIKYGIIYDLEFFEWLEANQDAIKNKQTDCLQQMIGRCCEIKAEIVAKDEKESGIRALLNLGHTFGHAIEAEQGYGNWLHGEAVAAGIMLACQVAKAKTWLSKSELLRVESLLNYFNLPVIPPKNMGYEDFMRHMAHDKKVVEGQIRFVIPRSLGQAVVTKDVHDTLLRTILNPT
jgi:3-dehydroquinate synthase